MTTYNKIGFLAAGVGNARGIGEYVKRLDQAGIPAVMMCNDGTVGVMDALELIKKGSKVPHILAYRVVNPDRDKGVEHFSVPNYEAAPADAARVHWSRIRPHFPPELLPFKEHVWFFPVNEIRAKRNEGDKQFQDMNAWDWMGEFCFELAQISMKEGFKVAMPQANSGEPAPGDWKQPGMVKYLKLCYEQPDKCAVGLHEYCWNVNDMKSSYPHQIGRFEWLFNACDELGIGRPNVLIGEWGWEKGNVPSASTAVEHIHWAAQLYAKYPTILGAGIWYLGEYQDNIDDKTQRLIEPVTNYTLSDRAKFPDPPAEVRPSKPVDQPEQPSDEETKTVVKTKKVVKIVKKKVSSIPESQRGLKLAFFRIQDRSQYSAGQRIWFEFHYDNLLGGDIGYGSMGMAVTKWTGSEWKLHALKHSYGGKQAKLRAGGGPGGGPMHDDNWKADQEGIFALTPFVSFDVEATNKKDDPGSVGEVFHMGMPVYVTIGSQGNPGGKLKEPPAPLFEEKIVEEEVVEIVEVTENDDSPPGESESGGAADQASSIEQTRPKSAPQTSRPPAPSSSAPSLATDAAEVNRQVIQWQPGSGVGRVRIVMSSRHGDQWLAHTDLTQALDANTRLELVFMTGGVQSMPVVVDAAPATADAPVVDDGAVIDDILDAGTIAGFPFSTTFEDVAPSKRALGMDVSYAQAKAVDFQKAADAGVRFCFIRAGSGRTEQDPNYDHNYAAAGRAGMLRGIYYYMYPEDQTIVGEEQDRTPEGQARRFVGMLKADAELGAVLDVEHKGLSVREVKLFVDEFQKHDPYGRPIMIYTANWFWNSARGYSGPAVDWAAKHPVWLAHYTDMDEPELPGDDFRVAIPAPWKDYTIHQWTAVGGPVANQEKKGLDLNYFNGTLADLKKWARGDVAPPPTDYKVLGTQYVTANVLNLRSGPSTDFEVLTKLKQGDAVDVIEEGKWNKVAAAGVVGYLSARYLSAEKPKKQPVSTGKKMDMAMYFLPPDGQDKGDIVILQNNYGQGNERQQLQREKGAEGLISYVTKNQQFEKRIIGDKTINLVLDTSPGEGEMYVVKGQWLPRHWAVGDNFIRKEVVTFFKKDGRPVAGKETYHAESEIRFIKHFNEWTSPGGVTLKDVVELHWIAGGRIDERYWFARNLGLVGWEKYDNRESHIVELIKRGAQHDNERESVAAV